MKCPKCGYLGFERVERCRNCGYDFPLAQPRTIPELPLREIDRDPAGLLDLELGGDRVALTSSDAGGSVVGTGRPRPIDGRLDDDGDHADLPLFGMNTTDILPIGSRALPPRPPLAVRRASPEIPRVRIDQPVPMLDLGLPEQRTDVRSAVSARDREPASAAPVQSAGLGARFAAGLIDLLVLAAVDGLVIYFTMQICGLTSSELGLLPVAPLLAFLVLQNGGYLVAFTAGGQTLGKLTLGIRVVSVGGTSRLDLGRSILRTLVWALMAVPAGLGFASALLDRDRRGWHDRCAGTRVVRAGAA